MNDTLVLMPYINSESQGNELELALTGWFKFCKFPCRFCIIGDYNPVINDFDIDYIYMPRAEAVPNQYRAHIDTAYKFDAAYKKYGSAYSHFIRMMDDNYAIHDFDLDFISKPYYLQDSFSGAPDLPASYWKHDMYKTRKVLDELGRPHINYATHMPSYIDFKKFEDILNRFDIFHNSLEAVTLYFNMYDHQPPIQCDKVRLGCWDNDILSTKVDEALANPEMKFMCNSVKGYDKELETKLKKHYGII